MAVLKYRNNSGKYATLSIIENSGVSDISMDNDSLFLIDSSNNKIGDGVSIEDIASNVANNSNDAGGIISVIDDDE